MIRNPPPIQTTAQSNGCIPYASRRKLEVIITACDRVQGIYHPLQYLRLRDVFQYIYQGNQFNV